MYEIVSVQLLRALAALMVAFGHAQEDSARQAVRLGLEFAPSGLLPWRAGVDLFFVISGFIMVHASSGLFGRAGAGREFLLRRIVRIVPLYWLSCTAVLGLLLVSRTLSDRWPLPDAGAILAGYLFWPVDTFGDGTLQPFNLIGWTLNYEMFFYVVFAAAIGLKRGRAVAAVAALLAGLVLVGAILRPESAALTFWSSAIVLEFALGMGLALVAPRVALGGGARVALLAVGLGLLALDPLHAAAQPLDWVTPNDVWRLLAWGVPAALVVASAVLGEKAGRRERAGWLLRAGGALGDASYALYLAHPLVIVAVRKAGLALGLASPGGLVALVGLELLATCAVALLVHRTIEVPATRWLRARLAKPSAQPRPLPV